MWRGCREVTKYSPTVHRVWLVQPTPEGNESRVTLIVVRVIIYSKNDSFHFTSNGIRIVGTRQDVKNYLRAMYETSDGRREVLQLQRLCPKFAALNS